MSANSTAKTSLVPRLSPLPDVLFFIGARGEHGRRLAKTLKCAMHGSTIIFIEDCEFVQGCMRLTKACANWWTISALLNSNIQGFIQRDGGSGFHASPTQEIMKLRMVIIVTSMCCLESLSQNASEVFTPNSKSCMKPWHYFHMQWVHYV